jgi:hypothetical protein
LAIFLIGVEVVLAVPAALELVDNGLGFRRFDPFAMLTRAIGIVTT